MERRGGGGERPAHARAERKKASFVDTHHATPHSHRTHTRFFRRFFPAGKREGEKNEEADPHTCSIVRLKPEREEKAHPRNHRRTHDHTPAHTTRGERGVGLPAGARGANKKKQDKGARGAPVGLTSCTRRALLCIWDVVGMEGGDARALLCPARQGQAGTPAARPGGEEMGGGGKFWGGGGGNERGRPFQATTAGLSGVAGPALAAAAAALPPLAPRSSAPSASRSAPRATGACVPHTWDRA